MNAATQVFDTPELAGLILDYLDDIEIFRLQNLSSGTRRCYQEYGLWKRRIMHRDVPVYGYTVKPVMPSAVDGGSLDPKRVEWVYTSGPQTGEKLPGSSQTAIRTPMTSSATPSSAEPGGIAPQAVTAQQPMSIISDWARGYLEGRSAQSTYEEHMQSITLNWLLQKKFPKWKYYPISNMLGLEEAIPKGGFFTNPDAGYRPLLLMSPALSEVTVMDWGGGIYEVKNDQGVTMGDVVDAVLNGVERHSEDGGSNRSDV